MLIQSTMTITSMPFASPPSNLKVHMPSFFSSQYAPAALCMPRRPTCGLPSVLTVVAGVSSPVDALVPFDLFSCDVGTRCWTMVLLTANLY